MFLFLWLLRCTYSPMVLTSTPVDCRALLKQASQHMTAMAAAEDGKVLHAQMRTEAFYIKPGEKQEQHSTTVVETYAQGRKSALITPLVSTWQDEQYAVTVIKSRKTVLITRSQQPGVSAQAGNLLAIRDSVLQQGTITNCGSAKSEPGITHLELTLAKRSTVKNHPRSIEFWIELPSATIQKVQINYPPNQLQTRTVVTFIKVERIGATAALPASARRQVLTAQGSLQPLYSGYRLVDQSTVRPN